MKNFLNNSNWIVVDYRKVPPEDYKNYRLNAKSNANKDSLPLHQKDVPTCRKPKS
jgi:hypothetical protein